MITWSIEFFEYEISYKSRGTIRAHVLVDFINELFPSALQFKLEWWMMHLDGSSSQYWSRAGLILEGPNDMAMAQLLHFGFKATCN